MSDLSPDKLNTRSHTMSYLQDINEPLTEAAAQNVEAVLQRQREAVEASLARREQLLEAFIAQHGCQPDRIIQCEQRLPDGVTRYWVELKPEPAPATSEQQVR